MPFALPILAAVLAFPVAIPHHEEEAGAARPPHAWHDRRTGRTIRGDLLVAEDARIVIAKADGTRAVIAIEDLDTEDLPEVERRIEEIRRLNETPRVSPISASKDDATDAFQPFAPFVRTRKDDRWFYVESDGLPHAPFEYAPMVGIVSWQQQVPLPQPYAGENAWRFPLKPRLAENPVSAKTALYRGAIAIAVNGVPIFNALNNRGDDAYLAGELDDYGGHSGRADDYHYHVAPLGLQKIVGNRRPIAFALDGFAIYGLFDAAAAADSPAACPLKGTEPLDQLNGHFAKTAAGARGVYHYHATRTFPYINGGMRGEVTVENDQIEPQPRTTPVRPALTPKKGAKITAFSGNAEKGWKLEYVIGQKTGSVAFRLGDEGVVFEFQDIRGEKTTETYARRAAKTPRENGPRRRGGDRESPRDRGTTGRANVIPGEPTFKTAEGFVLTSPVVGADGKLPREFTCDGASHSPPLAWKGAPAGTRGFALVMHHSPDSVDVHVYWILIDLSPATNSLGTAADGIGTLGVNTVTGAPGYAPPCSKGPGEKTYTLTLYALSRPLAIDRTKAIRRDEVLAALEDVTIAAATLNVVYEREGTSGEKERPDSGAESRPARRPRDGR